MIDFTLKILVHIIGVGTASGLLYNQNSLLLIDDSSGFLYEYTISSSELKQHKLMKHPKENISKRKKIDFESVALAGDSVYVFGSGSGKNRNKVVKLNTKNYNNPAKTDLTPVYEAMKKAGKIETAEFNIEGALYDGHNWLLFHRGNGASNRNVIFIIHGKNITDVSDIGTMEFDLPQINGFRSGFSDAILVDDKIYFLATAENSSSVDADGRILGSLLGCIDKATMKIDFTQKISDTQKFEGLSLYSKPKDATEFLLCEDNDSLVSESTVYSLTLYSTPR